MAAVSKTAGVILGSSNLSLGAIPILKSSIHVSMVPHVSILPGMWMTQTCLARLRTGLPPVNVVQGGSKSHIRALVSETRFRGT